VLDEIFKFDLINKLQSENKISFILPDGLGNILFFKIKKNLIEGI